MPAPAGMWCRRRWCGRCATARPGAAAAAGPGCCGSSATAPMTWLAARRDCRRGPLLDDDAQGAPRARCADPATTESALAERPGPCGGHRPAVRPCPPNCANAWCCGSLRNVLPRDRRVTGVPIGTVMSPALAGPAGAGPRSRPGGSSHDPKETAAECEEARLLLQAELDGELEPARDRPGLGGACRRPARPAPATGAAARLVGAPVPPSAARRPMAFNFPPGRCRDRLRGRPWCRDRLWLGAPPRPAPPHRWRAPAQPGLSPPVSPLAACLALVVVMPRPG